MTLLGNHDQELTAEERQAIADEPRPGVWLQMAPPGNVLTGDGRILDQHETDILIASEIAFGADFGELFFGDLAAILGEPVSIALDYGNVRIPASQQRGGLHSDPLVRLLAFRAWGDRDRRWFERCHEPNCERAYGHDGLHRCSQWPGMRAVSGVEWTS